MDAAFDHSPEFQRLLAGDPAADLTCIALEIASDAYPGLDREAYVAQIDALAKRVRERTAPDATVRQRLGHINWVLFVEEEYHGNTEDYYDARNSYLNEVIDRKTGIPISLAVLYRALGERVGLRLEGLNLPSHFMLRAIDEPEVLCIDAFNGGELLDLDGCSARISKLVGRPVKLEERHAEPCSLQGLVLRLLRNLKAIYMGESDYASALPVLRRLVALGNDLEERRDLGVALLGTDRPGESVAHLEAYLAANPLADDAEPLGTLLRAARREAAERN